MSESIGLSERTRGIVHVIYKTIRHVRITSKSKSKTLFLFSSVSTVRLIFLFLKYDNV